RATDESFFAVCLKKNSKVIGNIYFAKDGPDDFKTYELGYVFNSSYWGNGYATEACMKIMEYAFKELYAHRIYARCNPENSASWKLMERLHMRKEGHFKNKAFFFRDKDGNPLWHDAYEYAILDEEFKCLNKIK
ncbi:MAG: GNAT family protein, partial [Clostridium sp.]|nr:GNAT family protein [Clostridium sp.]